MRPWYISWVKQMLTSQPIVVLTVQMCNISVDAVVIPIRWAEARTLSQFTSLGTPWIAQRTPSLVTTGWAGSGSNKAQNSGPQTSDRRCLKTGILLHVHSLRFLELAAFALRHGFLRYFSRTVILFLSRCWISFCRRGWVPSLSFKICSVVVDDVDIQLAVRYCWLCC